MTAPDVAQADRVPNPGHLHGGWLPRHESAGMRSWVERTLRAPRTTLAPSVQALGTYLEYTGLGSCLAGSGIDDLDTLLHGLNTALTQAPAFMGDDLIGLPFTALLAGIDPARGGITPFQLPILNLLMSSILQEWCAFLESAASNTGFRIDGEGWLSPAARAHYDFPLWKKESGSLPYWPSWHAFFTRTFIDRDVARPVADPASNATVISPNDGALLGWDSGLSRTRTFWFNHQQCSLADIFSSPIAAQQAMLDAFGLAALFEGGYLFQTCLRPCDFQRWWAPVDGEVLFDPIAIPGRFFDGPNLPDANGATAASLPRLARINARGLIVLRTEDHGHVCCIPLGLSEAANIAFDPGLKRGARLRKGQEMGMFNCGGASFAILHEKLPGKELIFVNGQGAPYPQRPVQPGGDVALIGSRIGVWQRR